MAAVDNFGTGSSTRPPSGDDAGLVAMADANAAVAAQLRSRFPGLPVIGVGHSMGGALAVLQQARHRSFDYLAVLGYGYQPLAGLSEDLPDEQLLAESAARFSQLLGPCPDGYVYGERAAQPECDGGDDGQLSMVIDQWSIGVVHGQCGWRRSGSLGTDRSEWLAVRSYGGQPGGPCLHTHIHGDECHRSEHLRHSDSHGHCAASSYSDTNGQRAA